MSLLMKRNSVRKFLSKPVPKEFVTAMLESAMQAPSANNQQPWEFIVVDDKDIINKLTGATGGARPLGTAPLCIIPMIKPGIKSPLFNVQDVSSATQNILLEATNLGLGAVWIGLYPLEERYSYVEKVLNITGDIHPFCMIAVGYPESIRPIIKRYDESLVHYNKWGE